MWIMGLLKGFNNLLFVAFNTCLPVEMLNVPQGGGYMYMCYMC